MLTLLRLAAALFLFGETGASALQPAIQIGPSVKVDTASDNLYTEPYLAVDPKNASHLVAAAMAFHSGEEKASLDVFVSFDAGATWQRHELSEPGTGIFDPWVAFGKKTDVYVSCMRSRENVHRSITTLHVSHDGGRTWGGGKELPFPSDAISDDHPVILFNKAAGSDSGRLYVVTERCCKKPALPPVEVFTSDDSGNSFSAPVDILPTDVSTGYGNAVVMSNGAVVILLAERGKRIPSTKMPVSLHPRLWVTKSLDGGRTFSTPFLIAEASPDLGKSMPMMVADTSGGPYRDSLYATAIFQNQLHVWSSGDQGESWREASITETDSLADFHDLRSPQLAASPAGVVAVAWRDFRNAKNRSCSRVLLATSVDGGKTFSSSAAVSPETCGNTPLNHGYEEWSSGGDYFGLAAGSVGIFYVMWVDSRDGHFALWTAKASVTGTASPPK